LWSTSREHFAALKFNASLLKVVGRKNSGGVGVRILFTADDAVTADKLRSGLSSCEITVHPFGRTLKRR
jgi:hypothetical protein